MSTDASSVGYEPGAAGSIPSAAPPFFEWRLMFLRVLAAAHVVVGVVELSRVAGNLLLQVGYMGGPLGLLSALTIHLARFLNSLLLVSPADSTRFWGKSEWLVHSAGTSHDFFAAMVAAHVALGMLNLALGQGLWRRCPWARLLEIALVSLAGVVAAANGVSLVWVGGQWRGFGEFVLLLPIFVSVPIVSFLMLPGTAALFRESTPDVNVARRKRPWWMLSLQWFAALLALALATGILLVFSLGPMVEVAWIALHVIMDVPWF